MENLKPKIGTPEERRKTAEQIRAKRKEDAPNKRSLQEEIQEMLSVLQKNERALLLINAEIEKLQGQKRKKELAEKLKKKQHLKILISDYGTILENYYQQKKELIDLEKSIAKEILSENEQEK